MESTEGGEKGMAVPAEQGGNLWAGLQHSTENPFLYSPTGVQGTATIVPTGKAQSPLSGSAGPGQSGSVTSPSLNISRSQQKNE